MTPGYRSLVSFRLSRPLTEAVEWTTLTPATGPGLRLDGGRLHRARDLSRARACVCRFALQLSATNFEDVAARPPRHNDPARQFVPAQSSRASPCPRRMSRLVIAGAGAGYRRSSGCPCYGNRRASGPSHKSLRKLSRETAMSIEGRFLYELVRNRVHTPEIRGAIGHVDVVLDITNFDENRIVYVADTGSTSERRTSPRSARARSASANHLARGSATRA